MAQAERGYGAIVSGNYFRVMGVGAAAGRESFLPDDDRIPGGHPVAVLSHAYWQRRFGEDREHHRSLRCHQQRASNRCGRLTAWIHWIVHGNRDCRLDSDGDAAPDYCASPRLDARGNAWMTSWRARAFRCHTCPGDRRNSMPSCNSWSGVPGPQNQERRAAHYPATRRAVRCGGPSSTLMLMVLSFVVMLVLAIAS